MVKGKFQEYLPTRSNSWTYSCLYCRAHLARHEDLISKSFQGSQGRAYLFNQVVNVEYSEAKQRVLLTGIHFVADVFCCCCRTMLGWKYERAFEASQRYKEGKVIVELAHLIKDNGWDVDWIDPPRRSLSALPSPTPSASSPNVECSDVVLPSKPIRFNSYGVAQSTGEAPQSRSAPSENFFFRPISPPHDDGQPGSFILSVSSVPSTSMHNFGVSRVDPSRSDSFNLAFQSCTLEDGSSATDTTCLVSNSRDLDVNPALASSLTSSDPTANVPGLKEPDVQLLTKSTSVMNFSPTNSYRVSSPTLRSSRLLVQTTQLGELQCPRKLRSLFQPRASSSSPSRTSLLPLISDSESDGEEPTLGMINHLGPHLTLPPPLSETSFHDPGESSKQNA